MISRLSIAITFAAALLVGFLPCNTLSTDLRIVERWLRTNSDTRSLKVEFVQSRSLRAIRNPLVQPGVLWLDYSTNQFRWQLGEPAKTIVVSRRDNRIAIMRTPLKRVEFRETGNSSSGHSAGLTSLMHGFPRTLPQFRERYRVLEIEPIGNSYEVVTQPIGPESEGVSRFRFVIDQKRYLLKGLVIDLKDGSSVTTTFKRVDRNAKIDPGVFHPDLTGYTETTFRQG